MSSGYSVPASVFVAVVLAACVAANSGSRNADVAASPSPSPSPSGAVATGRTLYEHTVERGLPIGTRIYGTGAASIFVFPGEKAPAKVTRRRPDVIVIE